MKQKKLITKIKTLPKFIKKHPQASPQSVMSRLGYYTKLASHEYYGQGLIDAMHYHDYKAHIKSVGTIKVSDVIMDRNFANLVMTSKGKNLVNNNIPKSLNYFMQIIIPSAEKALYRKLTIDEF